MLPHGFRSGGNFQLHSFAQREGIRLQFVDVGGGVDAQNVLVRRRLRLQEIVRLRDSLGEQRVMDQPNFCEGKTCGPRSRSYSAW